MELPEIVPKWVSGKNKKSEFLLVLVSYFLGLLFIKTSKEKRKKDYAEIPQALLDINPAQDLCEDVWMLQSYE